MDPEGRPLETIHSSILPPYLRKTKAIAEPIPWVDQKGVSTGAFVDASQAHRPRRTEGSGSRVACLAMVFTVCKSAARTWRLLTGAKLLPDVITRMKFVNKEKAAKSGA
ncbi:MAG: hypothetical protein AB7Q17_05675 [Phycisphaerae bacterium]